jgi:ribosomal protein S18 acetylase RimI-like enzyme
MLEIREVRNDGLEGLLSLYTQLHDNVYPEMDERIQCIWADILSDKHHHIIAGCIDGAIISSCVLIIVPNLTHGQRPYALIENVITDKKYRNKGYASQILDYAKKIAQQENCYKIMLMTGSKKEETLRFYERAGYNRQDKTAFIQWLK